MRIKIESEKMMGQIMVAKKKKWASLLWATLLIGIISFLAGRNIGFCIEPGLKYSRQYSPKEYLLQPQNWCILQNRYGIVYVANQGGVLEYDGKTWNPIRVPFDAVRSMAIDKDDTIFVGGINELGFLSNDSNGTLKYCSLIEHIDDYARKFGAVWKTHAIEEGIFFRTSQYLFKWDRQRQRMNIVLESKENSEDRINSSFAFNGKYFVNQLNTGLMQLKNGSLNIVPGGKIFSSVKTVYMIAPYNSTKDEIIIGTREEGFFIYNGKMVRPFPTGADEYLKNRKAAFGIRLSQAPGDIAVATIRGGVVILDVHGHVKQVITKNSGLSGNNVKYIYEDRQGNLWAALNDGISKIEYCSPISIYNENNAGLPGLVYSVARDGSSLYAGTSDGLFYIAGHEKKFKPVSAISSNCWCLLNIGTELLAATSTGVYQIKNNSLKNITEMPSYVLKKSKKNPNLVWIGTNSKLLAIYRNNKNNEWRIEHIYNNINSQIRTIAEEPDGNLWL
ncbi:MAG: hypothetical protein GY757_00760, partial [bacterium]|nr:hypothetical protein [bacterium]